LEARSVGVMTFGLSQTELIAVAESLLTGDVAIAVPRLPTGFTPAGSGAYTSLPPVTLQSWAAADGDRFSVAVAYGSAATIDYLAGWLPGGRARKIRDTTGVYLSREESYLMWIERPGTVVTLQGAASPSRSWSPSPTGFDRSATPHGVSSPPVCLR